MQDQLQVERLQHTYVEALHAYVSIHHPHVSLPTVPSFSSPQAHPLTQLLSLQESLPDYIVHRQFSTSPTNPPTLAPLPWGETKAVLVLLSQDRLMFPRMLMKLVNLRTLSSVHSEQVFALRLQDKKLPPLLSEIWDVHE